MTSKKLQEILAKVERGETLTEAEQRSLKNYQYRQTQQGKEARLSSAEVYADKYQIFSFGFPKKLLNKLEEILGEKVTGKSIRDYLVRLIEDN